MKQKLGTIVGVTLILLWCLLPVAWIISLSFKSQEAITNGSPGFFPSSGGSAGWQNYADVISNDQFRRAILNSIGISLIATTLSVIVATLAAYAVARLEFKGKRFVLTTALAIAMFPVVSLVGPLFDMWRNIGLFDTWPGLIIPYMTFTLPLAIYTLSAFFREIPWELEQAAQIDGATPAQAFRQVILPLAAPGTFTAAILVFIFAWNDFLFAITLTSSREGAQTVPAALAFFTGESQFTAPTGALAAAAILVTIPIILFVLFFQRRIVAGLTSGAVKG